MRRYDYLQCIIVSTLLSGVATTSKASARDDVQVKTAEECPIDFKARVAHPSGLDRFQSLAACSGNVIAPNPAPRTTPPAEQPLAEQPMIVRIAGVKAPAEAKKEAAKSRSRKKTVSAPSGAAFDNEIRKVAASYRIDPLFLHALVSAESSYKPGAVSRAGALGLMQIMPATGAELGTSRSALLSPSANLDAGARQLKKLQKRYGRNFDLILSAYNAGPGAVERYGLQVPPFAETRAYVSKVMQRYGTLRAGLSAPLASFAR